MDKNYETIKDMRFAILVNGETFEQFVQKYDGDIETKRLKRLWNRTNSLLNDGTWFALLTDNS